MREIKFRIRLKNKKTGEEIIIYNNIFDKSIGIAFYPIDLNKWEILSRDQYTGLTDKNDDEIYEGDILYCDKSRQNYICMFESGEFRFYRIDYNKKSNAFYPARYAYSLEIHQNPELMEKING